MTSESTPPLRSFVSLIRGTTYKGELVGQPGPVLLGLASIQPDGGFRRGAFKTYGGESPAKITLGPGDIYVSLKDVTQSGDLLGSVARVPCDILAGRLTQDTVKLQFDGQPINQDYVYWLLRTPAYRAYCRSHATGTTTLGLARDDFLDFPVVEPGDEDLSLVELLEALDDRIALLRETNATLEAIEQSLFKSWFVDFDPVRAKSQGLVPAGMDEATAALFPEGFEESALGPIPNGWRIEPLSSVCESIFSGGTPDTRKPEYWTGELRWFSSGETRDAVVIDTEKHISLEAVRNSSTRLAKPGDVLIASAGQGTTRGQTSFCAVETYINQSVVAVRTDAKRGDAAWTFLNLARRYDEMRMLSDSHSIRGSLTTKILASMKLVHPPVAVMHSFGAVVGPFLSAQANNRRTSRILSEIRDTLLPRLISGQLRLPEAAVPSTVACS